MEKPILYQYFNAEKIKVFETKHKTKAMHFQHTQCKHGFFEQIIFKNSFCLKKFEEILPGILRQHYLKNLEKIEG
jgi:hypothetical protein